MSKKITFLHFSPTSSRYKINNLIRETGWYTYGQYSYIEGLLKEHNFVLDKGKEYSLFLQTIANDFECTEAEVVRLLGTFIEDYKLLSLRIKEEWK